MKKDNLSLSEDNFYNSGYSSNIKNYSYCKVGNEVFIIPNSALKIISIAYRFFEDAGNSKDESDAVIFETKRIAKFGPANIGAIEKGMKFLKDFSRQSQTGDKPGWITIVSQCSIAPDKLKISLIFTKEFKKEILLNIQGRIPFMEVQGKNAGSEPNQPLYLNI